ncbi:MAG: four helix bundle suffix domain-containing protein [Paludibacteraceae bacterium]|nr:four helix bundle suffix domain-containing protein [Paludibacteraceae bacterium]
MTYTPKFLSFKNDPCGRQYDQMTQAARSGVANIAEGHSRHQTSRETEIKLLDVARASLAELMGDYYNYLLHKQKLPLTKDGDVANNIYTTALDRSTYKSDWLQESAQHVLKQKAKFDAYLTKTNDEIMANALMFLCLRTINQLKAYIAHLLQEFKKEGGFSENMTAERLAFQVEKGKDEGAPLCPKCQKTMIKRVAKKGNNAGKEFWSCSDYPKCFGTRNI